MKVSVFSKEHNNSENFNQMMEDKLKRLDKFFRDEATAKVTLSNTRGIKKVEVSIPHSGITVRAEHSSDDYYKSMDEVVEKLEGQLRKYKTRMDNKRSGKSIRHIGNENLDDYQKEDKDEEIGLITKVKKFPLKPMDEEEAILQMEMLGHNFFVFKFQNGKTGVIYKRKDGHYGLIEEE